MDKSNVPAPAVAQPIVIINNDHSEAFRIGIALQCPAVDYQDCGQALDGMLGPVDVHGDSSVARQSTLGGLRQSECAALEYEHMGTPV